MSIYTCIMQIEQRTKIWSLLLVTINKILCQFFEFTQNLKRSQLWCDDNVTIIGKANTKLQ